LRIKFPKKIKEIFDILMENSQQLGIARHLFIFKMKSKKFQALTLPLTVEKL
jgi:hypothetical protein